MHAGGRLPLISTDCASLLQIMSAYTMATGTLKTLLRHPSLQLDHINATMDDMAAVMADHAEIEEAVQSGQKTAMQASGTSVVQGEEELLRELEALTVADEAPSRAAATASTPAAPQEDTDARRENEMEAKLRAIYAASGPVADAAKADDPDKIAVVAS